MLTTETLTYFSAAGSVEFSARSGAHFFVQTMTGLDGLRNDLFTAESAGQDGAISTGAALLPRNITLTGTILGADQDASDMLLQQIFNPKLAGVLLYTNTSANGSRQRQIALKVEQAPSITRGKRRQFMISLVAHDPYFYDAAGEARTDIAAWLPMLEFDWEIPEAGFEFEIRQESVIINVRNEGDVDIGLRALIRASGTVVRPEIMHMGTRERIVLNVTLQAGELIEVDTRQGNKAIWRTGTNGVRARAFQLRGEGMTFFSLATGDNLIRYGAADGQHNMTVEIYAASRYVSA